MERAKLIPRVRLAPRALKPAAQADDWDDSASYENRKLVDSLRRIKELEHELRTKEAGLSNVIKAAESAARNKGFNEAARKYEFRMKEMQFDIDKLKRQNLEAGTELICPECGSVVSAEDVHNIHTIEHEDEE